MPEQASNDNLTVSIFLVLTVDLMDIDDTSTFLSPVFTQIPINDYDIMNFMILCLGQELADIYWLLKKKKQTLKLLNPNYFI